MKKLYIFFAITMLAAGCGKKPVALRSQASPAPVESSQATQPEPPQPSIQADAQGQFESRKEGKNQVLYKRTSESGWDKTGLAVRYDWNTNVDYIDIVITVSPDKTKAVYNKWDTTARQQVLYIANIDGSGAKELTRQTIPEGRGELNPYSIAWVPSGAYVVFQEVGGGAEGEESAKPEIVYYKIDLASGAKSKLAATPVFGYFKSLITANGVTKVVFEKTEFLSGDEADKAAAEFYGCKPTDNPQGICHADGTASMPNGFFIRDLKKQVTYPFAEDIVLEAIPETGGVQSRPADLAYIMKLYTQDMEYKKTDPTALGTPFWIYVENNQIILTTQHYIP